MKLALEIENASGEKVPKASAMRRWIAAALEAAGREDTELCIRIVGETEGRALNRQYRNRDYSTNVLSFPAGLPPELRLPLLGDLAICAPVVIGEALQQEKAIDAHWAHMLIHGTLHLLGYDHINDTEAAQMEALETSIVTGLGFPPPYLSVDTASESFELVTPSRNRY